MTRIFTVSVVRYMRKLVDEYGARTHDLLVNFRSKKCLVEFANRFWETIPERMKQSRIISHDQDEGEIRIVQYQSPNMVIPLVQDICATPLIGTTCVLTQTNWEAIQVACLLKDKRMPVRLIQSNEGFRLCDMDEMRFFNRILGSQAEVHLIDEVCWAEAKQALSEGFGRIEDLIDGKPPSSLLACPLPLICVLTCAAFCSLCRLLSRLLRLRRPNHRGPSRSAPAGGG